jgi:gas vesicle protein
MADEERTPSAGTTRSPETGRGLGGFAAGIFFGALIGAGIALMCAPESGEKTRPRLRRRLERLREETAEGLERAGASTRRDLARRRKRLEAGIERAADRARDIL